MSAIHLSSFHTASGHGEVNGKTYYWDFSEMFGPWFTDKDGNELSRQPGPRSHAFKAFNAWLDELKKEKTAITCPPFPTEPPHG